MLRIRMNVHFVLLSALLAGCAAGGDLIPIGENAWRVTSIDSTEADAARVAILQADSFCAKMGKVPVYSMPRTFNDMPARYNSTMEFQCGPRGSSPEALAEARMLGYRRDCAVAGFALGSPENATCALDIAAKSSPRAVPAR